MRSKRDQSYSEQERLKANSAHPTEKKKKTKKVKLVKIINSFDFVLHATHFLKKNTSNV